MGKKPNHAALLAVAGLAGLGILWYYSDRKQRERERNAFNELDASNLTPRQIWDKALEFGREERLNLRGELERANTILDRANEMCEVLDGLRKCTIMTADRSVPEAVKVPILEYWMERFFRCFGATSKDTIDAIFSDEKLIERLGKLQAAQDQYDAWLAELKKPYDEKIGDGKIHCSFCGKSQKEVEQLIAGPSVHICTECVELCTDIVKERRERKPETRRADHPPD